MAKVEIYTKPGCPYCHRARGLLSGKGVDFAEYDIASDPGKRHEMVSRSGGGTTTPQVFIGGKHVGGCDDIHELDRQGRLDRMLGLVGKK